MPSNRCYFALRSLASMLRRPASAAGLQLFAGIAGVSIFVMLLLAFATSAPMKSSGVIRRDCRLLVMQNQELAVLTPTEIQTVSVLENSESSPKFKHFAIPDVTWLITAAASATNYFADVADTSDGDHIVVVYEIRGGVAVRVWTWNVPEDTMVLACAVSDDGLRVLVALKGPDPYDGVYVVESTGVAALIPRSTMSMPYAVAFFSIDGDSIAAISEHAGPIVFANSDEPKDQVEVTEVSDWGYMLANIADRYLVHAEHRSGKGGRGVRPVCLVEHVSRRQSVRVSEFSMGAYSPVQAVGMLTDSGIMIACRALDRDRQSAVFIGIADRADTSTKTVEFERWTWFVWKAGFNVNDIVCCGSRVYALVGSDELLAVTSFFVNRDALFLDKRLTTVDGKGYD